MMKPFPCLLSAMVLAAAGLVCSAPAQAVGGLVDVNVIDRDNGARLPVYSHNGQWWVAGRPGARYAIEVRNTTGERVLGVMSVDGVNVINGETANWEQTGYVLSPWQSTQITGWRKSDSQVAAFNFTALSDSYAARTGRPDNAGVIGVAVFREKAHRPPIAMAPPSVTPQARSAAPVDSESAYDGVSMGAGQSPAPARANEVERRAVDKLAAGRLGTGHGERETSLVSNTEFERRGARPDEVITIRYDSRANLVALGVIPAPARPASRPAPFPESTNSRYVPDPY